MITIPLWVLFIIINIMIILGGIWWTKVNGGGDLDITPIFGCLGVTIFTLGLWLIYMVLKASIE